VTTSPAVANDLEVRFDFLPEPLREALIADIDASGERIREYDLDQPDSAIPGCLAEVIAYASAQLGLEFNAAILKVYRLTDARRSGAYDPHRDQPAGATVPIVVCSLRGQADLTIWPESGGQSTLRCVDNMVVLFKPTLLHSVSEPLGADGARYLLTLYFDIDPGRCAY